MPFYQDFMHKLNVPFQFPLPCVLKYMDINIFKCAVIFLNIYSENLRQYKQTFSWRFNFAIFSFFRISRKYIAREKKLIYSTLNEANDFKGQENRTCTGMM